MSINASDAEYMGTYYVEIKQANGQIDKYEKVSGNSPIEVARHFKKDAKKCKKAESTIYVISNGWRFGERTVNNYYK